MMKKIILHCPINISRTFSNLIREYLQKEAGAGSPEFEIFDEPHRLDQESTLLKELREGRTPALYLGHATDFGRLQPQEIATYFETLPDLPLGTPLKTLGFAYPDRYFHPITVIPFGVIYNKNLAGPDLPQNWLQFQDPKYYGKIIIPDRQRTISKVVMATLRSSYPDTYEQFIAHCSFSGSPIDVVNAVDTGEYQFGMVNVAFSRFSRLKNTGIIWMEEGTLCMPQVVAVGKGQYEQVRRLIDYIFGDEIQNFFTMQGFLPTVSGEVPAVLNHDDLKLIWNGWNDFLRAVAQVAEA
jgi:ABC-type Fe3+ transport system substrate-binding protein